ncbi:MULTISPECIES: alpha/beta fold hydrolase [unclassified Streptomyces]|uniref:alpha/beta fold hydrolase n=1 Tax=unclassified Streptomyces TaxID=2593676 RepID=UPI0034045E4F
MSRRPARLAAGPYAPPVAVSELSVISADGSRLHAELHGPEGAPAVVLAHGWTCSTAFWAPIVRELAADHRIVLYDQRGHGRSPAAGPGGYSTHALADDLAAVLQQTLAPGERAVVVGHSMGGMTLMAAADRPQLRERAAAVLLCNTGSSRLIERGRVVPLRGERLRVRVQRALLCSRAPLGPVTPLSRRLLKYVTMGPEAGPAVVDACASIVHDCPRAVRAAWARVIGDLDLDAEVGRLAIPTAVLAGTADRLTPLEHARALADRLPRCVGVTELDGLGHMAPVEDPAAVSGVIRGLVATYGDVGGARAAVPESGRVRGAEES